MLDPTFLTEIKRPIGYAPDADYQMRAVRIFLMWENDSWRKCYSPSMRRSADNLKVRNLALAWESALFMGDY